MKFTLEFAVLGRLLVGRVGRPTSAREIWVIQRFLWLSHISTPSRLDIVHLEELQRLLVGSAASGNTERVLPVPPLFDVGPQKAVLAPHEEVAVACPRSAA